MNKKDASYENEIRKKTIWSVVIYCIIFLILYEMIYQLIESRTTHIRIPTAWLIPVYEFMTLHQVVLIPAGLMLGCLIIFACAFFTTIARFSYTVEYAKRLSRTSDEKEIETISPKREEVQPLLRDIDMRLQTIGTHWKETLSKVKREEQRKSELIVYLAHDLRTPLTSMLGYLTLLQDEDEIPLALRKKYLGIVLDKGERLEELMGEFFDITRYNLSNVTLSTDRINLTRLLEQVVFEYRPMFAEVNLSAELHSEPDVMVVCDPEKIQRVLDNILKNAMNYSYSNTTIKLRCFEERKHVCLVIENEGDTIPKESLERVFDQFFRVDKARNSRKGGTGIGLAIAKDIVEAHNGRIYAESENHIVRFVIHLPKDNT